MNILFSSCGRRVELIRLFRHALEGSGGGKVVGTDINHLAPAMIEVDNSYIVPRLDDSEFIEAVLEICELENIDLIIPLIDPELPIYAGNVGLFKEAKADVLISEPRVIEICSNKIKTAEFFLDADLPHLKTEQMRPIEKITGISLPAVLKPCRGSGGKDVYIVSEKDELIVLSKLIEDPVLQEKAEGQEITIDCLVDLSKQPLRIVARERLEIRGGESSKGRTFKDKKLLQLVESLLINLGAIGPITVQCFQHKGEYVFTEINPRFGGGYPLSHASGANFPQLIVSMCKNLEIEGPVDDYLPDVYFCRYDQAFYLKKDIGRDDLEIINGE